MSVGIAIIILESNFTKEGLLMSIQVYPRLRKDAVEADQLEQYFDAAHNFWEEFVLQWRTGPYVGVAEYSNQVYQACLQLVRSLPVPEQQELWQHFGFSLDPKPEDCPSQEIWAAFSITADLTATFYHLVCDGAVKEQLVQ